MTLTSANPVPAVASIALNFLVKAETFLHDSKSMLQRCPGYSALESQLNLSVPSFRTAVAKGAVDGFRLQRTIDLLRTLYTFLLDDSTCRNIHSSGVGVSDWAHLVLPIPDVIAALKGALKSPPITGAATTTHVS